MKRSRYVASLLAAAVLMFSAALCWSPANAAPAAPASGGVFTINSTADLTTSDSVLTFREAILLSQGGTDGAGGLGRGLSDSEKALVSGCSYSVGSGTNDWHTTVGCGPFITDTIVFSIAPLSTIVLSSARGPIPLINDTSPTIIDGTGITPTLNAANVGAHNGLHISSAGNNVKALGIKNAPQSAFVIDGNNNSLLWVQAVNAGDYGIFVSSNNNSIVTSTSMLNGIDGIGLTGDFNTLLANTVISNTRDGLRLSGSAQNNYIGCNFLCGTVDGNEFAANQDYGLVLSGTNTAFNFIEANQIGTNSSGYGHPGNFFGGVLFSGAHDNYLGAAGYGRGNVIDGNAGNGLTIENTAATNHISKNEIGGYIIGNGAFGVNLRLGAHDNIIGGPYATLGNVIESNGNSCVIITGATTVSNTVNGNTLAFCQSDGLRLTGGAHHNIIGTDYSNQNDMFGNSGNGILLDSSAHDNQLGYNSVGSFSQINTLNGIAFQSGAHDNQVGGGRTLFNGLNGVYFDGATTYRNSIQNIEIYMNNRNGVRITNSAHDNVVGSDPDAPNTIIENSDGVLIDGLAYSNTVGYNLIGTDHTLTTTVHHNYGNGVTIDGGAHHNTIGVPNVVSPANTISFNWGAGIVVTGSTTTKNAIYNNVVVGNLDGGLLLSGGAFSNTVGSASLYYGNEFRNNNADGIRLEMGTHDNLIAYNQISQNGRHGVELDDFGTSGNLIWLTRIYNNSLDGINSDANAILNVWSGVSIYDNHGLGIDRNAPNDNQNLIDAPYPVITATAYSGGQVTLSGKATAVSGLVTGLEVEVYAVALDPSGFGEGKTYIGTAGGNAQGTWTLTFAAPSAGCYTTFQIESILGGQDASEFGPTSCHTYLPAVQR